MHFIIRAVLLTCLLFTAIGVYVWAMYLIVVVTLFVFPYSLSVVLGALAVLAAMAWGSSRGH